MLLFTAATAWRPPKCPWTDGWVKKMCCMYTVEYCSAIEHNERTPSAATRMDLERITLSEAGRKRQAPCDVTQHVGPKTWRKQTQLGNRDSQTWRTNLRLPAGTGRGEAWTGSLALADASYYMPNGQTDPAAGHRGLRWTAKSQWVSMGKDGCVYIHTPESLCCRAETNTTLWINHASTK